jgi:alpha-N-arabinofuranosidase
MRLTPSRAIAVVGISTVSLMCSLAQSGTGSITVHLDQPGPKISPMFYGLMTEEINYSYDGGLYGELIQNRAFKNDAKGPAHWSVEGPGSIQLDDANPVPDTALTKSLKVTSTSASQSTRVAVVNDGYWGVPIKPNTSYTVSLYAKAAVGFTAPLEVSLETPNAVKAGSRALPPLSTDWKKYTVTFRTRSGAATGKGRFVISSTAPGSFWISQVSLFPPTFHGRPNGNRSDLINLISGLAPTFLRMPGGNYLEGNTIPERFEWKDTIGDIAQRNGHQGPWGYRSTDGFGLYEFLKWCDDIRVEPVLAVYAGYSLAQHHVEPGKDLEPYVQDALDEIEFVTGATTTKWGAVRAKLGHPKPWKLTYVEIGNEDQFDRSRSYDGRYAQFYDAIKAKYPNLQLIATTPVKTRTPDVIDDHYYRSAAAMATDSGHYDNYSRTGPKIFVGEWASIEGRPTPTYKAAMGDAAWLMGLERNSDLVVMESYAPMLVNVNPGGSQWGTNLIGYDNLNSFGSPSYYVQSLFGKNTGDTVLKSEVVADVKITAPVTPFGSIGLGTWLTQSEYKDVTVEKDGEVLYSKDFGATGKDGWSFPRGAWDLQDGGIRQSTDQQDTAAFAGDPKWTDYTIHVKARKLAGAEGFMVRFHVHNDSTYWQWNVGGWGNSRSALERVEGGQAEQVGWSAGVTVETGKWYDIKVQVGGGKIACYLDGRLITRTDEVSAPFVQPAYVAASKVSATGELILKVVNVSSDPVKMALNLEGGGSFEPVAEGWQLTGRPEDQNSLDNPKKVAPKRIRISDVSPHFSRVFPAYSVTVIRVKPAQ